MVVLQSGEILKCPTCGKSQDEKVEDYVVQGPHGRVGYAYTDVCGWCDAKFAVTRNADHTYTVESS